MKQMILTGLGSEQTFLPPNGNGAAEAIKGAVYYLVFNNGELRVPVSQAAAEIVVKHMYGGAQEEPAAPPPDERQEDPPEEGAPQPNGEYGEAEVFSMPQEDPDSGVDEDGIGQI